MLLSVEYFNPSSKLKHCCQIFSQNGVINNYCQLADRDGIIQELSHIKSVNADGVLVDCWWGIIEAWNPQKYVWTGYRELFNLIHEFKLKLQVECVACIYFKLLTDDISGTFCLCSSVTSSNPFSSRVFRKHLSNILR